eukprot:3341216-Amphidinium_carterae.1
MAVHQNFTSAYSPQSSEAAEVNVKIIKQVMRRLLEAALFQVPWWFHALEYATQVLQCCTLSKVWDSFAFGKYVSVKKLENKKKLKTFVLRGKLGRLLVVGPMTDRSCKILVGSRIVRETTPRHVSDKLAKSITREKRRQVLKKVIICLSYAREPLPTEVPVASATKTVSAVPVVQRSAVAKFPTSKKAKTCLKSC